MAFIVNLKPIKIGKLQKKLQKERDRQARNLVVSKKVRKGIQENPIKRNQFSID